MFFSSRSSAFLHILLAVSTVNCCRNIESVVVQVKDKTGNVFNKTLTGCLERKQFEGRTITEAYFRQQKINVLSHDSVRHLIHLRTISFWGCDLERLEAFAFRNVPELTTVQFAFGNLKEIPKDVFTEISSLEILRIHNNQIDFIENEAFANLSSLRKLYGASNKLEYWNREWFEGSSELVLMDFQFNKIRTLPRRAFATMKKLKQIFFDYNEIETIQEEAFVGIEKLEYLGLRRNKLKELRVDIFPNKFKIDALLISANRLNFIENEVLNKISAKTIQLDFNPWKCPCLERINYWMFNMNVTVRSTESCDTSNVPICAYPKTFSQTCLEYVDEELIERYADMLRNVTGIDKACLE